MEVCIGAEQTCRCGCTSRQVWGRDDHPWHNIDSDTHYTAAQAPLKLTAGPDGHRVIVLIALDDVPVNLWKSTNCIVGHWEPTWTPLLNICTFLAHASLFSSISFYTSTSPSSSSQRTRRPPTRVDPTSLSRISPKGRERKRREHLAYITLHYPSS